MIDSQRDLAEWVARWAGWSLAPNGLWDHPHETGRYGQSFLFDPALAWRAEDELIELCRNYSGPFRDCVGYFATEVAEYVTEIQMQHECTRIEATHRALRAATGGE